MPRVFLLSPANASGIRARLVMNPQSQFELAVRLRETGAPLGEVFDFISGLYFRGKSAYARAFAVPAPPSPGALVIAAGRGLVTPETRIGLSDLREIASVPIDLADRRYRDPLERDAVRLFETIPPATEVVLLGSIATPKYLEPLVEIFGARLLFPSQFVGRGDMSRGGLMLRSAREGVELDYVAASTAARRGERPAKLPRLETRKAEAK